MMQQALILSQVVTINEAARMYYVARGTIRYHIDQGNLTARKVDSADKGQWLIALDSLISLWGAPKQNIAVYGLQCAG